MPRHTHTWSQNVCTTITLEESIVYFKNAYEDVRAVVYGARDARSLAQLEVLIQSHTLEDFVETGRRDDAFQQAVETKTAELI